MNNLSGKKRKKFTTAGALLLAVMLTMSACGENDTASRGENTGTNNEAGDEQGDLLPDDSGMLETGSLGGNDAVGDGDEEPAGNPNDNNDASDNGGTNDEPTAAVLGGTGIYTGQIDSNSIEITTEGEGAAAYRITEELAPIIENLPYDAKVEFEYTAEAVEGDETLKQNWLQSIAEIKE